MFSYIQVALDYDKSKSTSQSSLTTSGLFQEYSLYKYAYRHFCFRVGLAAFDLKDQNSLTSLFQI